MTPLTLNRRSLFAVAALAGTGALAGCHPLPTKPSGRTDGVPEAPKRITEDSAVCDTRPMLPRPVLSLDSSLLFTYATTAQLAGRFGAMLWDTAAGRLLPDSLLGVGSGYSSFRPDNSLLDAVGAFGTALLPDGRLLATTSEGIAVLDSLTGTPQGQFTT